MCQGTVSGGGGKSSDTLVLGGVSVCQGNMSGGGGKNSDTLVLGDVQLVTSDRVLGRCPFDGC